MGQNRDGSQWGQSLSKIFQHNVPGALPQAECSGLSGRVHHRNAQYRIAFASQRGDEWGLADVIKAMMRAIGTWGSTTAVPYTIRWPEFVYGHHPLLKDFIYVEAYDEWMQDRIFQNGAPLKLTGSGRSPSIDQFELWQRIEVQLQNMTKDAVKSASGLLVGAEAHRFSPNELKLVEIRLGVDGLIRFVLEDPRWEEFCEWPVVIFSNWVAGQAEWGRYPG